MELFIDKIKVKPSLMDQKGENKIRQNEGKYNESQLSLARLEVPITLEHA